MEIFELCVEPVSTRISEGDLEGLGAVPTYKKQTQIIGIPGTSSTTRVQTYTQSAWW